MKRGTIVLIIFAIIAAGVVGVSLFLQNQPPLEITVAVDPLAEDWIRESADAFNASDTLINGTRRVQVNVISTSDLDVWQNTRTNFWTAENHPELWIPASSASVTYAARANIPFNVVTESTARTPLLWGGYANRVDLLTADGEAFDWSQVVMAAETESWQALGGGNGFVNLAFLLPDRTMGGLGVLLSASAAYNDTVNLSGGVISRDFYDWLTPVIDSVQNFNTIGNDIAQFMARNRASVDIAIGPEVQWLNGLDGITRNGEVRFSYPEYAFVFDFPVAQWEDPATTSEELSAGQAFANYLLDDARQTRAIAHGLRPAVGAPPVTASLFSTAEAYGVLIDPPLDTNVIQPPSATDIQSLIQWFTTTQ
ncbi:MAG: substrate-binding domain-containing protein [Aggregatilineales bacterium]